MAKQPTPVNQLLFQRGYLTQLLHKKTQHDSILSSVREVLPTAISQHCLSCASTGNKLTLFTQTASWAAQIRYYGPIILEHLNRSSQPDLRNIQIRILPTDQPLQVSLKKNPRPSKETINTIQRCAQSCTHDKLKQSLLRLASTLQQKRSSNNDLS